MGGGTVKPWDQYRCVGDDVSVIMDTYRLSRGCEEKSKRPKDASQRHWLWIVLVSESSMSISNKTKLRGESTIVEQANLSHACRLVAVGAGKGFMAADGALCSFSNFSVNQGSSTTLRPGNSSLEALELSCAQIMRLSSGMEAAESKMRVARIQSVGLGRMTIMECARLLNFRSEMHADGWRRWWK
jgi:hypothetical protein